MRVPLYQVDSFSRTVFSGNPAAVCPLPKWLSDAQMQDIAAENNLSETAYLVGGAGKYDLRWFTSIKEVKLCGHATLASAYVVCTYLEKSQTRVEFQTRSGTLVVRRDGDLFTMDFPARPSEPQPNPPPIIAESLGATPREVFWSVEDFVAVFDSEAEVRALKPDFRLMSTMTCRGIIATAKGSGDTDFVSRFFGPQSGIAEDPVTGSAHCTLVPFWAPRINKTRVRARQVSQRGGELFCELRGNRVDIAGYVAPYLEGFIEI